MIDQTILYPDLFTFSVNFSQLSVDFGSKQVPIQATSYGLAIGNAGPRIWDVNQLSATSTSTIVAGTPLKLPFVDTFLPHHFFDAIVEVRIGLTSKELIPFAFSNSLAK